MFIKQLIFPEMQTAWGNMDKAGGSLRVLHTSADIKSWGSKKSTKLNAWAFWRGFPLLYNITVLLFVDDVV